jgi:hypothetical protein
VIETIRRGLTHNGFDVSINKICLTCAGFDGSLLHRTYKRNESRQSRHAHFACTCEFPAVVKRIFPGLDCLPLEGPFEITIPAVEKQVAIRVRFA